MTTVDRMADGYEPRWDLDFETGEQGQLFVVRAIDAIRDGSAEIKTDERALQTRNVYLEYQCQYRGEWKLTGIAATEAELWCHVIGEIIIIAPTRRVRDVARYELQWKSRRKELTRGSHPTKGVCIPLREFVELLALGVPATQQPLEDT